MELAIIIDDGNRIKAGMGLGRFLGLLGLAQPVRRGDRPSKAVG